MKRFICGIMVGCILTVGFCAVAGTGIRDVRLAIDTKLIVNGQEVKTDIVYGVLESDPNGYGKNYVSARDLAEALGQTVTWNEETQSIIVGTETGKENQGKMTSDGITTEEYNGEKYVLIMNILGKYGEGYLNQKCRFYFLPNGKEDELYYSLIVSKNRKPFESTTFSKDDYDVLIERCKHQIINYGSYIPLDYYETVMLPVIKANL